MKKIIGLTTIVLLTFALLTGCGCSKKENNKDEIKTNTNENVIKDQQLEVFQFTNTSLIYEDNNSYLQTTVTNTSTETQYLEQFNIIVKDSLGNVIITLPGFVGAYIEPNASKIISSSCARDLTTASSIEYEIVR